MEKENDDIDKINDQIQSILDEEKDVYEKKSEEEDGHVVYIDRLNSNIDSDTKKINTIEDIEADTLEKVEDTKKIEKIEEVKDEIKEEVKDEIKEEVKEEEKKEEVKKKNNKKNVIIIVISILVILLLISIILFLVLNKEETIEEDIDDKLSKSEQKEIINDYGNALTNMIAVYYDKQKVLLEYKDVVKLVDFDYDVVCSEHEIYDDGSVYLNKCEIDKIATKYSYGKKKEVKEEVLKDGDVVVYVGVESNRNTFKEPSDKYNKYTFHIDGKYSDLTLLSEYGSEYVFYMDEKSIVHMINFKTGKKVLDPLTYDSVLPISVNGHYDTSYVAVSINEKWGIYNITTRERVVPHKYQMIAPLLSMGISGPQLYVETLENENIAVYDDGYFGIINYQTGKEVIPVKYNTMLRSGSYLWAVDNNKGHILDFSNNEYLNDKYDEVYGIVDGKFVLVKNNGKVQMIKIDGKILYDYGKLEFGPLNYFLSYNGALFSFHKTDDVDDYDNCFEITYNSDTKEGEAKDFTCGGIAKPILYLYPKKTTNVTVTFEHPEYLETTYPKYNNNWSVTAKKNGDLYDKDNNYYYALYWDELKVHNVNFDTGYYVEAKDAITFLEKKLDYIGLSPKEKNEFIMYWLPVLEKNGKSLVYFELTEERESYNKININPKPDSLLRLVIHIKKVDKKVDIKKQTLTKFQRKGFVAVEWGGTTY